MGELKRALVFLATVAFLVFAGAAAAQVCMQADFDDDGDPWTLQTVTAETEHVVKLILEVPPVPPIGEEIYISVEEPCSEDPNYVHYYGARGVKESVTFDPAMVDFFEVEIPTCIHCHPWGIRVIFSDTAPMAPGERHFIGQFDAYSICDTAPPFDPGHVMVIGLYIDAGGQCEPSFSELEFLCPHNPVSEDSWSTIKGFYR